MFTKTKIKLHIIVGALLVLGASLFLSCYFIVNSKNVKKQVVVSIPSGYGLNTTASKLVENNVISHPIFFRIYAKVTGHNHSLKAGVYRFEKSDTMADVLAKIVGGKSISYQVTIPEGLRSAELYEKLFSAKYITSESDKPSFDENIFYLPETYRYTHGENITEILKRMNKAAHTALDLAWNSVDEDSPIKTKNQLMTLASIIEKETAIASERARISGVFINRLKRGMRLQTDPTVIYGASNYNGNITRKHLREAHPYNTYVIKGLPPGPICHPGADAINAAANPEKHDFLYFVANGKGGHTFAKTYAQHQKNVREYLEIYRSNIRKPK